jgi:SAM-dependent methyltransferase
MFSRLAQLLADVKSMSPFEAGHHFLQRLSENYHECRLGIRTMKVVTLRDLGIDNSEFQDYVPVPYRLFKLILKGLTDVPTKADVFLDYGCGMGRAVILAAMYPFRRVIGVELCPALAAGARDNLRRAESKFLCKDIRILTEDAARFVVPHDVSIIHLYNPFVGETLARVLENIWESLCRHPRKLTLLVGNSFDFASLAPSTGILKKRRQYRLYRLPYYDVYDFQMRP